MMTYHRNGIKRNQNETFDSNSEGGGSSEQIKATAPLRALRCLLEGRSNRAGGGEHDAPPRYLRRSAARAAMRDVHRKRLHRDASRQRPPAPPNRKSFLSPVERRVLVSMAVFLLAAPVIFAANGPNSPPNHNARAASVASTILPPTPTQKSGRAPPAARKLSTFGCPSTCEGFTCGYWVDGGGGYSCASLESEHGFNCVGCACAGESPVPSAAPTATTLPTSSPVKNAKVLEVDYLRRFRRFLPKNSEIIQESSRIFLSHSEEDYLRRERKIIYEDSGDSCQ